MTNVKLLIGLQHRLNREIFPVGQRQGQMANKDHFLTFLDPLTNLQKQ